MNPYDVAERMAGFELKPSLAKRIHDVDVLCKAEGGGLRSRQVVAMIVCQWLRDEKLEGE